MHQKHVIGRKRHFLALLHIEDRHKIAQVKSLIRVAKDESHLLHGDIGKDRIDRIKRNKSWMHSAENVLKSICDPNSIEMDNEWVRVEDNLSCHHPLRTRQQGKSTRSSKC